MGMPFYFLRFLGDWYLFHVRAQATRRGDFIAVSARRRCGITSGLVLLSIALLTSCAIREELPPEQWQVAPRDRVDESCNVPAVHGLLSGEDTLVSFQITAQAESIADIYEKACMDGQVCACREALSYWQWTLSGSYRVALSQRADRPVKTIEVEGNPEEAEAAIGRLLPQLMRLKYADVQAHPSRERWEAILAEFPGTQLADLAAYQVDSYRIAAMDQALASDRAPWNVVWAEALFDESATDRVKRYVDQQLANLTLEALEYLEIDLATGAGLLLWLDYHLHSAAAPNHLAMLLEGQPAIMEPDGQVTWSFSNQLLSATVACGSNHIEPSSSFVPTHQAPRLVYLAPAVFALDSQAKIRAINLRFDASLLRHLYGAPTETTALGLENPHCTAFWNLAGTRPHDDWFKRDWKDLQWSSDADLHAFLNHLTPHAAKLVQRRVDLLEENTDPAHLPPELSSMREALQNNDLEASIDALLGSVLLRTLYPHCVTHPETEGCINLSSARIRAEALIKALIR